MMAVSSEENLLLRKSLRFLVDLNVKITFRVLIFDAMYDYLGGVYGY